MTASACPGRRREQWRDGTTRVNRISSDAAQVGLVFLSDRAALACGDRNAEEDHVPNY